MLILILFLLDFYNETKEKLCPFPGCRGMGNGVSKVSFHENLRECPLLKKNWLQNINYEVAPRVSEEKFLK